MHLELSTWSPVQGRCLRACHDSESRATMRRAARRLFFDFGCKILRVCLVWL